MAGPGLIIAFGILLIGFIFKNIIQVKKTPIDQEKLDSLLMDFDKPGDVFLYLMLLSAHFIKLDNKIHPKEKEFVYKNLHDVLPPDMAKYGIDIIKKAYEHDTTALLENLDLKAKAKLSYSTKLNIIHYLRALSVVDKVFSEENELKALSGRLGVSMYDYDKIATLSYNKELDPGAILEEQKRFNLYEIKVADYLIFNKFFGAPDDPAMESLYSKSFSQALASDGAKHLSASSETDNDASFVPLISSNFPTSEDVAKKMEKIEKEIREKTFDERIDEFKDERIKQQIAVLDKKLHLFLDVLSQKLEPEEITYKKYKKTFEQVYMMTLKNIKEVVASQKVIESIDKETLKAELAQLKEEGRKQHVKTRQERLRLFEKETSRLNEILLNNERAIQEMEEVTFEIGRLKGTKGEDQRAIKEAIQDLDEWTDKVKLYNKR